ncbi:hypothetical protein M514_01964, partial [Trichuris suis]
MRVFLRKSQVCVSNSRLLFPSRQNNCRLARWPYSFRCKNSASVTLATSLPFLVLGDKRMNLLSTYNCNQVEAIHLASVSFVGFLKDRGLINKVFVFLHQEPSTTTE